MKRAVSRNETTWSWHEATFNSISYLRAGNRNERNSYPAFLDPLASPGSDVDPIRTRPVDSRCICTHRPPLEHYPPDTRCHACPLQTDTNVQYVFLDCMPEDRSRYRLSNLFRFERKTIERRLRWKKALRFLAIELMQFFFFPSTDSFTVISFTRLQETVTEILLLEDKAKLHLPGKCWHDRVLE